MTNQNLPKGMQIEFTPNDGNPASVFKERIFRRRANKNVQNMATYLIEYQRYWIRAHITCCGAGVIMG
jgi:hypothetical protein